MHGDPWPDQCEQTTGSGKGGMAYQVSRAGFFAWSTACTHNLDATVYEAASRWHAAIRVHPAVYVAPQTKQCRLGVSWTWCLYSALSLLACRSHQRNMESSVLLKLKLKAYPQALLLVVFADKASVPRAVRLAHAPAPNGPFVPFGQEHMLGTGVECSLKSTLCLQHGKVLQYLQITFVGHMQAATGEHWAKVACIRLASGHPCCTRVQDADGSTLHQAGCIT